MKRISVFIFSIFIVFSSPSFSAEMKSESFIDFSSVQTDNEQIQSKEEEKAKEKAENEKEYKESKIEKVFKDRLLSILREKEQKDILIKQFGYDFFEKEKDFSTIVPIGKSYTVGPGDQINIYLWGDPVDILNLKGFYSFEVDKDGKIYIPNLGVFYVWGLNVKDIKNILKKALGKKFKKFEVDVTLGKLREYPVYVSGFVKNPGIVMVKGSATVLDVLVLSGGIQKNGSLRNITLTRKIGKRIKKYNVDLYDLFVKGIPVDLNVKEGDSIYVSPIGNTVAIYGSVKRDGIYEVKGEKSLEDIIALAGGILPSVNKIGIKINRIEEDRYVIKNTDISHVKDFNVKNGDLIYVEELNEFIDKKIEAKGHIKYPGVYSSYEVKTLKKLIEKAGLLPDTNLYYGEILRKLENTNTYQVINFVPLEIIKGIKDIKLRNQDIVSFYPDWIYKPIVVSGVIKNPVVVPYYKGIKILDVIRNVNLSIEPRKLKAEIYSQKKEVSEKEKTEEKTFKGKENLKNIAADNEQREPSYERTIYLYDLLIKGDEKANIELKPGDKVLLKITEDTEKDKTVTILGEVKKPGIYKYRPGIRLYDIIKMAGGYTQDAYPKGIIFIRKSAKKLQEEQLNITMLALEESLSKSEEGISAVGATAEEQKVLEMTIRKQKRLLSILKQKARMGLGRIALDVPLTLEALKNSPENIELSDGDYIYVPSKPNYVLVLGGVYNQISLPYRKSFTVEDYLKLVGGLKENADVNDIYIIKANGRVLSKKQFASVNFFLVKYNSFLKYKPEQGDAIVVPTKMKVPIMWRPLLRDITQIIFQSISTAVLAKRL